MRETGSDKHYAIHSPGQQWQEQLAVKAEVVQTRSLVSLDTNKVSTMSLQAVPTLLLESSGHV